MISNLNKAFKTTKIFNIIINNTCRFYSKEEVITPNRVTNTAPSFKRIENSDYSNYNNNINNDNNKRNDRINNKKQYNNNHNSNIRFSNNNNNNNNYENNNKKYKITTDHYYKLNGEGVYGINPVWIALSSGNRSFNALYVCGSMLNKLKSIGIDITKIENHNKLQFDAENNYNSGKINNPNEGEGEDYHDEESNNVEIEEQENNSLQTENQFNRNTDRKNINALKDILRNAFKQKIPVIAVRKNVLNSFSKSRPHQSFVLDASELTLLNIDFLQPFKQQASSGSNKYPLWLVLDELWDPQNVGAIVRSCSFFDIDGIVISDKNSCPITPTASKSSSGACESFIIHRSESITGFLKSSKSNGWRIVGTSLSDLSEENKCLDITQIKLDQPTILIIGNEGFGLKSSILELCDTAIKISGGNRMIDSLNASVTSGILIHQLLSSSNKN